MIRKTDKQTIAPYLRDASNFSGGAAEEVVIPENEDELINFLKMDLRPVTIAGAGTGLTASRIPSEGVVLSTERMNQIGPVENGKIWVGPAVTLNELQTHLKQSGWFYPPNPTETWASIGGNLATNASGSRSYKYGVTRDYICAVDCVLADGRRVLLERGQRVLEALCLDDGSQIEFPEIGYASPNCKNAAGYFIRPGMDWIDLFIGSDGTLGIFMKTCLKLLPQPDAFLSGILFFGQEKACWDLVPKIKSESSPLISPCSLEYFDRFSLEMLRGKYPNIPPQAQAALFFEQDVPNQKDYDTVMQKWFDFLSDQNILLDDSWFAQNQYDAQVFHDFRHEIPVMVNEENSRKGRTKIGTDMAVPDKYFMEMMNFYQETLSGTELPYVIFGHLGDNHLHINLLPETSQKKMAESICNLLAEKIISWGGTVSAEHGIGKLKKNFFKKMVGQKNIEALKNIKSTLDPQERLGKGNIF